MIAALWTTEARVYNSPHRDVPAGSMSGPTATLPGPLPGPASCQRGRYPDPACYSTRAAARSRCRRITR